MTSRDRWFLYICTNDIIASLAHGAVMYMALVSLAIGVIGYIAASAGVRS